MTTHPEVPQATAREAAREQAIEVMAMRAHATTVTLLGNSDSAWLARCANCDWRFVAGDRIKTVGRARFHEAESALTALLEATQHEPCPTCADYDYEADCAAYRKRPIGEPPEPCSVCNGSQRVPGAPLVILGPEQVACTREIDGATDLHRGWIDSPTPWTPLFRAPFIEAQREEA